MAQTGFVARGGLWVLAQFFLIAAVVASGLLWPGAPNGAMVRKLGGGLMILGAVFAIAGFLALGRHTTPFIVPRHPGVLVQHGIYRWIRHPLYTSLMVTGLGWSVFWMSWAAALATLALTIVLHLKATREERLLTVRFPEYAQYRANTKKFLPWIY